MKPAFGVKSARLDVLAVQLHTIDLTELEELLRRHTGQYRELDIVPFILNVQDLDHPESLNTGAVASLSTRYGTQTLGLRHTGEIWTPYTAKLHLVFTLGDNVSVEPQLKTATPAPVQTLAVSSPTILVGTPICIGQQVYTENADLVVASAVGQGTELIVNGNVHVYTPMRGYTLVGTGDNRNARIFIHSMQVELVSVAGICRDFEQDLLDHLRKKPVQISLQDDRLIISAIDTE